MTGCIEDEYKSIFFPFYSIPNYVPAFMWIIGVLGNAVNLLVFSHRKMSRSSVDSMFWWLSLSDLLQLILIVPNKFVSGWCSSFDLSNLVIFFNVDEYPVYKMVLLWSLNYLLLVSHTITSVLNIALAFMRYSALIRPFENSNRWDRGSINRGMIYTLILSFVVCCPFLYGISMPADTYVFFPPLEILMSNVDFYKKHGWTYVYIQLWGMILRAGLLLVLIVTSIMLMIVAIKIRRSREDVLASAREAEKERAMKQVTNLIMIILFMFLITDVPMAADGIISVIVAVYRVRIMDYGVLYLELADNVQFMDSITVVKVQLDCFLQFSFIVNCSYSVICYLLFTSSYRKTLKLLLGKNGSSWFSSSNREDPENATELENMTSQ